MKFKVVKYNPKTLSRVDSILPKVEKPVKKIDLEKVCFKEKGHYTVAIINKKKS